jgi:hypothetical protein
MTEWIVAAAGQFLPTARIQVTFHVFNVKWQVRRTCNNRGLHKELHPVVFAPRKDVPSPEERNLGILGRKRQSEARNLDR